MRKSAAGQDPIALEIPTVRHYGEHGWYGEHGRYFWSVCLEHDAAGLNYYDISGFLALSNAN